VDGRDRLLLRLPDRLVLQDVHRDGRMLLVKGRARVGLAARPPGEAHERELSWFDWSVLADLSPDGRSVLFGEQADDGSGLRHAADAFLRTTDGSPAMRLGRGSPTALSPDGSQVLALDAGTTPPLRVFPTGTGQEQAVDVRPLVTLQGAAWFPDGRRMLIAGNEPDAGPRLYVLEPGAPPRPITPEGVLFYASRPISPDGSRVAVSDDAGRIWLYLVADGTRTQVPGVEGVRELQWTADGAGLYVVTLGDPPAQVLRVDAATGARQPVLQLMPLDPAGVRSIYIIRLSSDGRSYAYSYGRFLSELILVDGVR
jgi:hypothetical protein